MGSRSADRVKEFFNAGGARVVGGRGEFTAPLLRKAPIDFITGRDTVGCVHKAPRLLAIHRR